MKKKILAIAMFVALGLSASAQSDGFFASNYSEYREGGSTDSPMGTMPSIFGHNLTGDQNAEETPVGSGLLLLGGMALAYGMRKKD